MVLAVAVPAADLEAARAAARADPAKAGALTTPAHARVAVPMTLLQAVPVKLAVQMTMWAMCAKAAVLMTPLVTSVRVVARMTLL